MAKAVATTDEKSTAVAAANTSAQVPAFMQANRTNKAKIGNTDSSDLIIPRVKLLQKISPEVDDHPGVAVEGQFWHTIAEQSLGSELRFVPLLINKSTVLWAPRGDDRGILARSSDNVNWDQGSENQEFEIQLKGQPKRKIYTRSSVAESGLAEFGSTVPGDKRSAPLASLTYTFLMVLLDFPELSPVAVINTRSAIRPAKLLQSKIDLRPAQHYGQVFKMFKTDEVGDEGSYNGYGYLADGYVSDEDQYHEFEAMYRHYSEGVAWRVNDDADEAPVSEGGPTGERPTGEKSSKY